MRRVIISDIDGTLALFGNKNPYRRDFMNDELNIPVAELIRSWDGEVIYISGRDSGKQNITYNTTVAWLLSKRLPLKYLYMRPAGDNRMDAIIKQEILFEQILQEFEPEEISFILDDRQQVVDFWRAHGFACFQVAPSPD